MSSSVKSPSRSNMNGMARFQWRQYSASSSAYASPCGSPLRAGAVEQPRDRLAGLLADDLGVDDAALGLGEDLGLADLDARLGRDDADAGVAVGVHEAQRDDPVEPGVGDLVGHGRSTLVATARGGDRLLQGGDSLGLLDSLR